MKREIDALLRAWSREIAVETELARVVAHALNRAADRREEMIAEITRAVTALRGERPAEPEMDRIERLAREMFNYRGQMQ